LQRVAEVVKRVIDYEIFSILLLNERAQELRFAFRLAISLKLRSDSRESG
jgi:hypothetical protein